MSQNVLGLWCLTSLSQIFHIYCDVTFIAGGNLEYAEKTSNLSQVTAKHSRMENIAKFEIELDLP